MSMFLELCWNGPQCALQNHVHLALAFVKKAAVVSDGTVCIYYKMCLCYSRYLQEKVYFSFHKSNKIVRLKCMFRPATYDLRENLMTSMKLI